MVREPFDSDRVIGAIEVPPFKQSRKDWGQSFRRDVSASPIQRNHRPGHERYNNRFAVIIPQTSKIPYTHTPNKFRDKRRGRFFAPNQSLLVHHLIYRLEQDAGFVKTQSPRLKLDECGFQTQAGPCFSRNDSQIGLSTCKILKVSCCWPKTIVTSKFG